MKEKGTTMKRNYMMETTVTHIDGYDYKIRNSYSTVENARKAFDMFGMSSVSKTKAVRSHVIDKQTARTVETWERAF